MYVVVVAGVAVTVAPVVPLNPVEGLHEYDEASPEAVRFMDAPLQMPADAGDTATAGKLFTVTVTLFVCSHPVAVIVSVNVYTVVTVGFAVGFDTLAELNPVAGLQL